MKIQSGSVLDRCVDNNFRNFIHWVIRSRENKNNFIPLARTSHIVYHSTSFGTKFFQHDYKTIQPKIRQFWKETWALMLICYCLFNLCTCFFKCSIYLLSLDAMHIRYWPRRPNRKSCKKLHIYRYQRDLWFVCWRIWNN